MSQHRLFYFMELKEPKAACGLFPSLSWCCYRVEWRPGQKFHDTYLDIGDCVIEILRSGRISLCWLLILAGSSTMPVRLMS